MAAIEFRNVTKTFPGGVDAVKNLQLAIDDEEFIVLVGPSGCGKSTALRLVAGLERPTSGQIVVDGEDVSDKSPQDRNIAMVFQNYALYPHKTVRGNLEFPLRMMNLSRHQRTERIQKTAKLLGLEPLLDRRPKQLSGGQRQRVAMGRAIVRDPLAFLMDEPLSNLDAKLRVQIRAEIANLQRDIGVTTVYVTHDQVEAMTLGDRIAVMFEGELQQVASAQEVYEKPVNTVVATFIGSPEMGLFRGPLKPFNDGLGVAFGDGTIPITPHSARTGADLAGFVDDEIIVGLRPGAFVPAGTEGACAPFQTSVWTDEALGHEQILYVTVPVERITELGDPQAPTNGASKNIMAARISTTHTFEAGDDLELAVRPEALYLFDGKGNLI